MGIKTIAVYSDVDFNALHVRMADEAVYIGPSSSNLSYLNIESILDAVKQSNAEAVHPGYGFLSEDPSFCKAINDIGIVYVGPSYKAIRTMGNKIEKILSTQLKWVNIADSAREIGYPVMMKPALGGGGRGIRIARDDEDIKTYFQDCLNESISLFGDDSLFLEKYLLQIRHVEFQIIGDNYGNIVYLPERECSVQRRNQKVIEETPCVAIDQRLRKEMGMKAVDLAKSVDYTSVGTIEFLLDEEKNYYFLEMNTRIQVEHTITEMITGIDLVEQMILIAQGERTISQEEIKYDGSAIQCRVYAEDAVSQIPVSGILTQYEEPQGDNIRCDSGVVAGTEISVYYDPLITKLCVWHKNRSKLINETLAALHILNIKGLLNAVLSSQDFRKGTYDTQILATLPPLEIPKEQLIAVVGFLKVNDDADDTYTEFVSVESKYIVVFDNEMFELDVAFSTMENFTSVSVIFNDKHYAIKVDDEFIVNGNKFRTRMVKKIDMGYMMEWSGMQYKVQIYRPKQYEYLKYMKPVEESFEELDQVASPMNGIVLSVAVEVGDTVLKGSELCVVEAMKMQNVLRAPFNGKVKSVNAKPNQKIRNQQVLIQLNRCD